MIENVVHTPDECSSLPQVPNLQSETQLFPVSHGDVVKVFCGDSFNLVGDEFITCNKDSDFTSSAQPTCIPSKNFTITIFGLVGELVGMSTTALIASNCTKATVMENSLLEKSSPYDIAKILTCT